MVQTVFLTTCTACPCVSDVFPTAPRSTGELSAASLISFKKWAAFRPSHLSCDTTGHHKSDVSFSDVCVGLKRLDVHHQVICPERENKRMKDYPKQKWFLNNRPLQNSASFNKWKRRQDLLSSSMKMWESPVFFCRFVYLESFSFQVLLCFLFHPETYNVCIKTHTNFKSSVYIYDKRSFLWQDLWVFLNYGLKISVAQYIQETCSFSYQTWIPFVYPQ